MIYGIRPPSTANVGGAQPNRPQGPANPLAPDTRIDQRRAPVVQAPQTPVAPTPGTVNSYSVEQSQSPSFDQLARQPYQRYAGPTDSCLAARERRILALASCIEDAPVCTTP